MQNDKLIEEDSSSQCQIWADLMRPDAPGSCKPQKRCIWSHTPHLAYMHPAQGELHTEGNCGLCIRPGGGGSCIWIHVCMCLSLKVRDISHYQRVMEEGITKINPSLSSSDRLILVRNHSPFCSGLFLGSFQKRNIQQNDKKHKHLL